MPFLCGERERESKERGGMKLKVQITRCHDGIDLQTANEMQDQHGTCLPGSYRKMCNISYLL